MNINIFGGNEITDSVRGTLEKRMHSPLYGVYILAWVAYHWEVFYAAFFVDQGFVYAKYHQLRNEYLASTFLNYRSLSFYLGWVIPVIVTYLVIWQFPRFIGLPAFRKDEQYKNAKKTIALHEAAKIQVEETKLEEKSTAKLEASVKRVKKKRDLEEVDPTVIWKDEFDRFRGTNIYADFQQVIDSIYDHSGNVKMGYNSYSQSYEFEVPQTILVYSDTNGLVELSYADNTNGRIKLTDKGKYFVNQFMTEKTSN